MLESELLLLDLLARGLGNESVTEVVEHTPEVWEECYALAGRQNVAALAMDGLAPYVQQLPRSLKFQWISCTDGFEKRLDKQFSIASELADAFAREGLRTLVLKGLAVGSLYPHWNHRFGGDLDCYLLDAQGCHTEHEYAKGNSIAVGLGCSIKEDYYKHSEFRFKGLMVENHRNCMSVRGSKRLKHLESFLGQILKFEQPTPIGDSRLERPGPFFTAIFVLHHAQDHFLSETINLRFLTDWAMILRQPLDWENFRSLCEEQGMIHIADSFTRLAVDKLGAVMPDGYRCESDDERDSLLLASMLNDDEHIFNQGAGKLRLHLRMLSYGLRNGWKFRLFSDTSVVGVYMRKIKGLIVG